MMILPYLLPLINNFTFRCPERQKQNWFDRNYWQTLIFFHRLSNTKPIDK